MNFQKVKAVLFDLDGTLLDTIKDIGTCVNSVMCRYGYPTRSIEEYKMLVGHGARNLMKSTLPEGTSEEEIERIRDVYVPYYRDHCDVLTDYFPGVYDFLRELRDRGYQIGMITNKSQATADRLMGKYFPDIPFTLLWGNNYIRPLKPSPESGELACKELGRAPEEVLFVGDGDTDMKFARNCGFIACGVTWGYRSRQTLLDFGAEMLINDISELAEKLF